MLTTPPTENLDKATISRLRDELAIIRDSHLKDLSTLNERINALNDENAALKAEAARLQEIIDTNAKFLADRTETLREMSKRIEPFCKFARFSGPVNIHGARGVMISEDDFKNLLRD